MNCGEEKKNEREAGALMERASIRASIYRERCLTHMDRTGSVQADIRSCRDEVWTTLDLSERKIMTNGYGKPFRGSRNSVRGELVTFRRAATRPNEGASLMSHVSRIVDSRESAEPTGRRRNPQSFTEGRCRTLM